MAFGDNSAARARRAELIEEQAATEFTIQATSGALYRVYKDLPPGIGWVLRKVGTTVVPKWYYASKELCVENVDRHDVRFAKPVEAA